MMEGNVVYINVNEEWCCEVWLDSILVGQQDCQVCICYATVSIPRPPTLTLSSPHFSQETKNLNSTKGNGS